MKIDLTKNEIKYLLDSIEIKIDNMAHFPEYMYYPCNYYLKMKTISHIVKLGELHIKLKAYFKEQ